MALRTILFPSKVWVPNVPCQAIDVCLTDEWIPLTVDGTGVVVGTIENSGRYLGSAGMPFPPSFENPRGNELYEYSVTIDDTLFTDDNFPTCEDIVELFPYPCIFAKLKAYIDSLV